ncbi:hypothetical protein ALC56_06748 [Trachymyrmex septentrionalis]|uniref:Uncharacterized protein n=1 Tax=Trachymyrmex septentrionalis TaxID=34720 RepID=A0A195FFE9_9HYME|nr:hypothetical protein ALC56_06748 [Trachymyrmex septentrionalis]
MPGYGPRNVAAPSLVSTSTNRYPLTKEEPQFKINLTLYNCLNNNRKKIKRDYSFCKIIIVRPIIIIFAFLSLQKLSKNGKSIIVIPDLEILGGCLKISNGILRDLSSLKRIGNATIFNTEQTRSIQASFGLSTLQLKCHYELTIGFITFSGNIFAAINGLGIAAKLNVDYDDYNKTYDASLEHFQIKLHCTSMIVLSLSLLFVLIARFKAKYSSTDPVGAVSNVTVASIVDGCADKFGDLFSLDNL